MFISFLAPAVDALNIEEIDAPLADRTFPTDTHFLKSFHIAFLEKFTVTLPKT